MCGGGNVLGGNNVFRSAVRKIGNTEIMGEKIWDNDRWNDIRNTFDVSNLKPDVPDIPEIEPPGSALDSLAPPTPEVVSPDTEALRVGSNPARRRFRPGSGVGTSSIGRTGTGLQL